VFRLDFAPVDLGALATDIAKTLSTSSHDVPVAQMAEVVVPADPARVSQCLENIVSNAIRHSPRGAPVTMFISKKRVEEGEVGCLEVIDDGPGVPVEILPRIFERFAMGAGSPGLGLGLYLAKRIALAHGGELTVESPPGKGARFRLELPIDADY
jgi:signal transduction histidine kinase